MRLRRRLAELEARLDAIEADRFNGQMPPSPTIDSEPVDPQELWRVHVNDYAAVNMVDVPDERATGVYI